MFRGRTCQQSTVHRSLILAEMCAYKRIFPSVWSLGTLTSKYMDHSPIEHNHNASIVPRETQCQNAEENLLFPKDLRCEVTQSGNNVLA